MSTNSLPYDFLYDFRSFLVGNDFTPHLPSVDIGEKAFDILFQTYRECASNWGDNYLVKDGVIECGVRLEELLTIIGRLEQQIFQERIENEAAFAKRRKKWDQKDGTVKVDAEEIEMAQQLAEQQAELDFEAALEAALSGGVEPKSEDYHGDTKVVGSAWCSSDDFKRRYYYEKFGLTVSQSVTYK